MRSLDMLMKSIFMIAIVTIVGYGFDVTAGSQGETSIEILESEPSPELSETVGEAFGAANKIQVSYMPRDKLGTPILPKELLAEESVYKFAYRCSVSCDDNAGQVQSYFSNGLRQASECPGPYYALVNLVRGDKSVFRAYIDYTGRCFSLDGNSYYSEVNFDIFLASEKLYPDFVVAH